MLGLAPKQFRDHETFQSFESIAVGVTEMMINSDIITDFRHIANVVKETYMGEYLIGPSGHQYKVDPKVFSNCSKALIGYRVMTYSC